MAAMNDFQFKFRHLYTNEIENNLYSVDNRCLDIAYHAIQQIDKNKARCLICNEKFSVPLEDDTLLDHFEQNSDHDDCEALDTFSKVFMSMPTFYEQLTQLFFKPLNPFSVHCEICNLQVEIYRVHTHLNLEHHKAQQLKKLVRLDWIALKQEIFKVDAFYKDICAGANDLFFSSWGKAFYCFICNCLIENCKRATHWNNKHKGGISKELLNKVFCYDNFFVCCDVKIRAFKKYFAPGKDTPFLCILCEKGFDSYSLIFHVSEFPCVFLKEGHHYYDSSLDFEKHRVEFLKTLIFCSYDESVDLKLYPKYMMKWLYNKDNIPPFTLQKRDTFWYCLLCHCLIIEDAIDLHLGSKTHIVNSSQRSKLLDLVAYHKFWMAHSAEYQYCQSFFSPWKGSLKCYICKDAVAFRDAIEHSKLHNIQKEQSVKSSTSNRASGSSTPQTSGKSSQISGRGTPQSVNLKLSHTNVNRDDEQFVSQIVDAFSNKVNIKNHDTSKVKLLSYRQRSMSQSTENSNVESFDDNYGSFDSNQYNYPSTSNDMNGIHDNFVRGNSAAMEDANTEMEVNDNESIKSINANDLAILNGVKASVVKPPVKTCSEYCETTELKLYSDFNRSKGERRPTIFFIQNRNSNYFCLFCNKYISRAIDHISTKKHIKNSNDNVILAAVRAYHDYWMLQPPELQLDQIHYNPFGETLVQCQMCNNKLLFKTVKVHSCPLKKAQEEGLFNNYDNILKNYDEFTVQSFFPKSFMKISKGFCKFDMPIGIQWEKHISCYLCGQKLYHEHAIWMNHIALKHMSTMLKGKSLKAIKSFHEFWIKQPVINQIFLVTYLPNTNKTVVCLKDPNHVVNFENAVSHRGKCEIDEIQKLIKKLSTRKSNPAAGNPSELPSTSSKVQTEPATLIALPKNFPLAFNHNQLSNKNIKKGKEKPTATSMEDITDPNFDAIVNHKLIPSITKVENDHLVDAVPNRFREGLQVLAKTGSSVNCLLCNITIHDAVTLVTHISTKRHLPNAKWSYFCEICPYKCVTEDLWQNHLQSNAHTTRVINLVPPRPSKVQEYECYLCKLVLFGDTISIIRHKQVFKPVNTNKKSINNGEVKNITLDKSAKELFASAFITEKKANEMAEESDCAYNDDADLNACILALENTLSSEFPGTTGYPFGSRFAAIGNKKSDLDIFMDIGNMYYGLNKQSGLDQQEIVLKVRNLLSANKKEFDDIYPITKARTPIIRVIHVPTKIDCDLSFRNGLSVENTKFLSFCFDIQPQARLGMLILREWAKIVGLKEEITSYALCMMFIFHLQLQGYLMSVSKLRQISGLNIARIDGWEVINYENINEDTLDTFITPFKGDVHELLREFFNFYSKFNFAQEVACPLLGKTILKRTFNEIKFGGALPIEMNTYKEKYQADPDVQFRTNCVMCVQDPFDLGHNLTKSVPRKFKDYFMQLCLVTYKHMTSNP